MFIHFFVHISTGFQIILIFPYKSSATETKKNTKRLMHIEIMLVITFLVINDSIVNRNDVNTNVIVFFSTFLGSGRALFRTLRKSWVLALILECM